MTKVFFYSHYYDNSHYFELLAGHGLGPHVLGGGGAPQPGMGIFAMMATLGTLPVDGHQNINGQLSQP